MSATEPVRWARGKRDKVKAYAASDVGEHSAAALAVCLAGVPLAAALGFCANGDAYNTTGWRVGDESERQEALRKGRRPFVKGDPREGYGGIGQKPALHELGYYGVEAGKTPTPVATDPDCPWVKLATSDEVRKILGRPAVTGGAWYGATADLCAVGLANLRRHWRGARADLHPSLQWDPEDKRRTLWRWALAMMRWSAGTGGIRHVNAYADELAALPEAQRWGRFVVLAARDDSDARKHRSDEYSAIRTCQKIEAGVVATEYLPAEPWALEWLREDGLTDAVRPAVYARLAEVSQ